MMPNEVEAYRVGEKAFEYKGTSVMIMIDIASRDVNRARLRNKEYRQVLYTHCERSLVFV